MDKAQAELGGQRRVAELLPDRLDKLRRWWELYRNLTELRVLSFGKDMLDIGCGIATGLHFFPEASSRLGVDPLANEYKQLYEYPSNINIEAGHAEGLDVINGVYDLVLCTNVLDHADDPVTVMDEIRRVMACNGRLFFMVEVFGEDRNRDAGHPHSLRHEQVHSLLRGFWPEWCRTNVYQPGVLEWLEDRLPTSRHEIITGLWRKL